MDLVLGEYNTAASLPESDAELAVMLVSSIKKPTILLLFILHYKSHT